MRQAYGKPTGLVARIDIGEIIISVRTKDANRTHAIEALRRAKYKFPGRQNIVISNKWGFTNLTREQYLKYKEEDRLTVSGLFAKTKSAHGPLGEDHENKILVF